MMEVIMKVKLANHLGVFNPGDPYEASEKSCLALIAEGYAFDPKSKGPETEPWDGDHRKRETAEAEPKRETAAKKAPKKRGRPRKVK